MFKQSESNQKAEMAYISEYLGHCNIWTESCNWALTFKIWNICRWFNWSLLEAMFYYAIWSKKKYDLILKNIVCLKFPKWFYLLLYDKLKKKQNKQTSVKMASDFPCLLIRL